MSSSVIPRFPTVTRNAARISAIVTTGMGTADAYRGCGYDGVAAIIRSDYQFARKFKLKTNRPGQRRIAIAPYPTTSSMGATSPEEAYFRSWGFAGPTAVIIAATGPYPHIEMSCSCRAR